MGDKTAINRLLSDAYARNGSKHVAFIDETFRSTQDFPNENPFYLMTAVLIDPRDFHSIREGLEEIAEGKYWHSTQEISSSNGRKRIKKMLEFLNQGDEVSIISHYQEEAHSGMSMEQMRKTTFQTLCGLIFGESSQWNHVNLAVLERRNNNKLFNIDENNFRAFRKAGIIPPQGRLLQVSPAEENLLWLPDLVTSVVRQEIARNDSRFFDLIRERVYIVRI